MEIDGEQNFQQARRHVHQCKNHEKEEDGMFGNNVQFELRVKVYF